MNQEPKENNLETILRAYAMQYEKPVMTKNPEDITAAPTVVGMERRFLFEGEDRKLLKDKFLKMVGEI
jgi:hypothetical protein